MTKRVAALALSVLLALTTLGCGKDSAKKAEETPPTEVLATAKKKLDDASSWHLKLTTTSEPKKGNGVLSADGVGTHAPAWKGDVQVMLNGIKAVVPVVAVDGKVHAKLLGPTFSVINPSEYDAPNPADFMDPATGISSMLTQLADPKKTGKVREGAEVLTTYEGTLPGSLVATTIPSASKTDTYPTTVGINDKGQVSTLSVTGPFFADTGDVTYDITISDYDQDVKITAP